MTAQLSPLAGHYPTQPWVFTGGSRSRLPTLGSRLIHQN